MKTRYANVTVNPDRHGKLRARYRKAGHKPVYMKTLPDQPGFEAELKLVAAGKPITTGRCIPGSVNDLCSRFYECADFKGKGNAETRAGRMRIIESFRNEFGNDMVRDFGFEHIEAILLRKTEPGRSEKGRATGGQVAAVKLRKQLMRLFAYAKKLKWIQSNPVEDAEKVGKDKLEGFYAWTEDDITKYKARHPLGTKARLALEIILWTGQRRGDARQFGPKHVASGSAAFVPGKTGRGMGMMIAPDLRAAIDAMPSVGITTFLVTDYGKPFSHVGFGNKMREWCDQAGLPQCSAHGLRKAIARRVAETEGTQRQIKAVGGWRSDSEVTIYTEGVEQKAMADVAITRVIERFGDT
jgi:integrase